MKMYFDWWVGMFFLLLSCTYYFSEKEIADMVRFYGLNVAALICFISNTLKLHIDEFNKGKY